jgi:hypothetical protein
VQAGDQHPQQTQQAQNQERVVEPQPAACINTHQNACSYERVFERKAVGWHKHVTTTLVLVSALVLVPTGCLPSPQKLQSVELLDRLADARGMFGEQPPRIEDGCNSVGDVQTRLLGEPGISTIGRAWTDLREAADALQAACGQGTMLAQPASYESEPLRQARQRWQDGIQREMRVACDHLRDAASALGRATPC